jgi:nitroreductase
MSDLLSTMRARHAVRDYIDRPIDQKTREALQQLVDDANRDGNLDLRLVFDEPTCFSTGRARYGKFSGVRNYLVCMGAPDSDLERRVGYYGERVVLGMQELEINSCWVALTHGKPQVEVPSGEKVVIIICFGYGATQGTPHKSKPITDLYQADETPDWFLDGMEAAQLAPTAINQQRFRFILKDGTLSARAGVGPCTKIDLGIAQYHFEAASGHKVG